ncbi:MAG: hypothetical protein JRJ12_15500, partial [Deltaproteobacteria bacterium]|nr:hypothetical protein [Deltaproteobacteria bacterium]
MRERTWALVSRFCFRGRFLNLLVLILAMLLLGPLLEEFTRLRILMDIFWTSILVSALYAVSQKKRHVLLGILLVLPMLASIWSKYVAHEYPPVIVGGSLCGALFMGFVIVQIVIFIYKQQEISRDLIVGAVLVYLLMALMWTFIFTALNAVAPNSFNMPRSLNGPPQYSLVYYSFVTITTLGYGDITPATSLARSLCILEAVIGQLYL